MSEARRPGLLRRRLPAVRASVEVPDFGGNGSATADCATGVAAGPPQADFAVRDPVERRRLCAGSARAESGVIDGAAVRRRPVPAPARRRGGGAEGSGQNAQATMPTAATDRTAAPSCTDLPKAPERQVQITRARAAGSARNAARTTHNRRMGGSNSHTKRTTARQSATGGGLDLRVPEAPRGERDFLRPDDVGIPASCLACARDETLLRRIADTLAASVGQARATCSPLVTGMSTWSCLWLAASPYGPGRSLLHGR
jgi:hypothetical protein